MEGRPGASFNAFLNCSSALEKAASSKKYKPSSKKSFAASKEYVTVAPVF